MALAVAAAGCGFGEGERDEGEATLTVTRDYGAETLVEATVEDPSEADTVIRALDREAHITTRYGGGFVQSIEELEGKVEDGRNYDWFFYVNGIESPVGSADVQVHAGDRIWWDYRDWTDAMRVPAVVGSWPEPFLQAATPEADRLPVRVECAGGEEPCEEVVTALEDEGVAPELVDFPAPHPEQAYRVLVGTWADIREDRAAAQIERGPQVSGVFSTAPQTGLIAAVRFEEDPATWVVTGVDAGAVEDGAEALDEAPLADRYAVEVDGSEVRPLPASTEEQ